MSERILVVDDDPLSAEFIVLYLRDQNYEVLAKNSLKTALSALREFHPHIVVTDFDLGDGSGLDLAQSFKEEGGKYAIGISGFTNLPGKSRLEERNYFDLVLLKPLELSELAANLKRFLTYHHD